jgi:hypothetical protein
VCEMVSETLSMDYASSKWDSEASPLPLEGQGQYLNSMRFDGLCTHETLKSLRALLADYDTSRHMGDQDVKGVVDDEEF